jgi:hypothetical protein
MTVLSVWTRHSMVLHGEQSVGGGSMRQFPWHLNVPPNVQSPPGRPSEEFLASFRAVYTAQL